MVEARPLYERALWNYEKALGLEYPDALSTSKNLIWLKNSSNIWVFPIHSIVEYDFFEIIYQCTSRRYMYFKVYTLSSLKDAIRVWYDRTHIYIYIYIFIYNIFKYTIILYPDQKISNQEYINLVSLTQPPSWASSSVSQFVSSSVSWLVS